MMYFAIKCFLSSINFDNCEVLSVIWHYESACSTLSDYDSI